jgi:hypothetical protein
MKNMWSKYKQVHRHMFGSIDFAYSVASWCRGSPLSLGEKLSCCWRMLEFHILPTTQFFFMLGISLAINLQPRFALFASLMSSMCLSHSLLRSWQLRLQPTRRNHYLHLVRREEHSRLSMQRAIRLLGKTLVPTRSGAVVCFSCA